MFMSDLTSDPGHRWDCQLPEQHDISCGRSSVIRHVSSFCAGGARVGSG